MSEGKFKKQISIILSRDTLEGIDALARRHQQSRNAEINNILDKHVEELRAWYINVEGEAL